MPDPAQLSSVPASEPASIPTLEGWIESLMNCKQLPESDVQRLCEKVRTRYTRDTPNRGRADTHLSRLVRSSRKSLTFSQWYVPCLQNTQRS